MCILTSPTRSPRRRSKQRRLSTESNNSSQSQPQQLKPIAEERIPNKSVSFDEMVMVRPVLHLNDYNEQERNACWYNLADRQRVRVEIMGNLRQMKVYNGPKLNDVFCVRGLEKLSDNGKANERRQASIREVLEEQETQRAEARAHNCTALVFNVNRFRTVYRLHSRMARSSAHAIARIDEAEAVRSYQQHPFTEACPDRGPDVGKTPASTTLVKGRA